MNTKERRQVVLDSMVRQGTYTFAEMKKVVLEKGLGSAKGEISDRTLRSDLQQLGETTGCEVVSEPSGDNHEYRYRYQTPPDPLATAYLESKHLRALYLAREALRCTQTIPEAEVIGEAIQQLEYMLSDYDQALELPQVDRVVRFAESKVRPVQPEIWETLFQGVAEQREVSFRYYKAWGGDGVGYRARVQPLRLVNLEGEWYLFALYKGNLRQYHLLRMDSVRLWETCFDPPADLDFDGKLENTFGRFFGDPHDLSPVTLRFSERIYPSISGHKFHPKQRLEPVGDGRMDLTFWVTKAGAGPEWTFYSVRCFVLSYGADCEVISPPDLRELVKKDLDRTQALYGPEETGCSSRPG